MGDPVTTALIVSAIAGTAQVGMAASQAHQERKHLKSVATAQDEAVQKAEAKAKGAEKLAKETAVIESRKRRRAQTRTILTSPLGVQEDAIVSMPRLFGGN